RYLDHGESLARSEPVSRSAAGEDRAIDIGGERQPAGLWCHHDHPSRRRLNQPAPSVPGEGESHAVDDVGPVAAGDRDTGCLRLLDERPQGEAPGIGVRHYERMDLEPAERSATRPDIRAPAAGDQ